MDLWHALAKDNNLKTTLVRYNSADELISALENGEVRAAIGPISITQGRAQRVEFTQPYMQSGIGIATTPTLGIWGAFKQLFSRAFLIAVLILITVLAIVGTLLWVFERRVNDHFDDGLFRGVANGCGWLL